MPYRDQDKNNLWIGFYSTRPWLKFKIRQFTSFLEQVLSLKQLVNLRRILTIEEEAKSIHPSSYQKLLSLYGILIHHDAITGTASHLVVQDYLDRIEQGLELCQKLSSHFLTVIMDKYTINSKLVDNRVMKVCYRELG